ncbi:MULTISPECIES: energy transducer TonB [Nitrosomonas]|uniref:Protein TonB n=2 Tax=Nitrosomonas TaxID=914 RepID=A0A5D3YK66_9PROT|nr:MULTISPECIES: energy transducer TonB [Nitrosomonas]TYP94475.1 protein TonB [Nitrosomonas communis]UVS62372.1 energy transducer TonB [Nitrosomonas sp. PLL12]
MNQLHGWPMPILVTCLVHSAITMLPINLVQKNDRIEDETITFRLVSLPQIAPATQSAPSPLIGQPLYRPEKKPSAPKQIHQEKTTSVVSRPSKAIARASGKAKEKTTLPQPTDGQESSSAANVAMAGHPGAGGGSGAGSGTQMPSGPVMLSSELSVICPVMNSPSYPSRSRILGEHGKLMLKLELDESGRVKKAQVTNSSGYSRLDEAAITAVKTWRCKPPLQNGQPVPVIAFQPFSFVLKE